MPGKPYLARVYRGGAERNYAKAERNYAKAERNYARGGTQLR
jgi:hypothetical protein